MYITNYDIEAELRPNLSTGEKLVWTGKPKQGILLRKSDIFLIPFSLFWAGFAIFWQFGVSELQPPFIFKLWGLPFVCIGLYITVGRFFLDAKKRANTTYGITNDRIIIKSGIFSREIKSLNIRTLSDISFSQKADNSGTIVLGTVDFRSSMMQGMEWPGLSSRIAGVY
ncbi:PH domain-containing protein [Chitinophaga sedimenti]|uniref:PH domain-containing protein n=1 Tax=Chitinophaga sedimenti TaxID=2033606 RepID=UPI002002B17C|nr:PH domain-containing protein [Chitinophaga sedimenti]MCK7558453.1 PH domain-containing protein [Chitinophaga sedimenti]